MSKNYHRQFLLLAFCFLPFAPSTAAGPSKAWVITLEEPTGIYRRDHEVVTVKLNFAAGEARKGQLRVLGPDGQDVLSQLEVEQTHPDGSIKTADLLLRATLIPGERPEFRLITSSPENHQTSSEETGVIARRIGVGRVELANERFGVILNLGLEGTEPALVAAYNKTAGEARMLNLIDTSPDVKEPLAFGKKSAGFGTFLAARERGGAFNQVDILEAGPLRAKVRLSGSRLGGRRETWEFVWHAGSPVLRWRASLDGDEPGSSYGFFFSSVSASPYVPFDRWIDGSEERWPDGWETDNPPDHKIGGQDLADLPGRHLLYYRREENYGALDFYELDAALAWKGIGARQFYAATTLSPNKPSTEMALAFPRWKGTETALEGRAEYRRFIQPILSVVMPREAVEGESGRRGDEATGRQGERNLSSLFLHPPVAPSPRRPIAHPVSVRPVADLKRETAEQIFDFSLNGPWQLNWAEKSEGEKQGFHRPDFPDRAWRTVQVPGSVHTQILEAPKYYTQEADWISEKEWWYRRSFRVPPAARGKRLRLRFEATDYYTDIWLNGRLLGRHEGYIDPYEFDVTDKLDPEGENQLAVRVWTAISYYWRHRPYTVKGSYGAVDQKPDHITAEGITRPVHLLAGGPVAIRDVAVDTRLNQDGSADVIADIDLDPGQEQAQALRPEIILTLTPRNFDEPEGLELRSTCAVSGQTTCRFVLHVERPRLWWTWDHGRPNLYTLDVVVKTEGALSDRRSFAVGIREVEHVDWKFYLNGRRMFIRGTNSYYNLFQSEMRRADYERDLGLMRAMNINLIRLHCHFSNPDFYDLADELGILVWQDYLEAWYPEDPAFALKAATLYDPHIKYVRNHPSVAVWATSDEESPENYRVLTKHLEPRLYALDPQRRPVVRSTGRYGDGHIYYGWYEGSIWQYAQMTEKFVSELGATALPNYESLMKFIPDAWPIKDHEEEWVFRKLQIPEAMKAWGEPGGMTLQEYIPQTQAYVARLFQLSIERQRRLKYRPAGGILHFHAIDIWPSVTMAALDFWRQPTKAYFTVQRSFQMVLPSFAYDRDTWQSGEVVKTELWLINDHWFALPAATVTWRLENNEGKVMASGGPPGKVDLAPDSSLKLMDVSFTAGPAGSYVLWAKVVDRSGKLVAENNYEFKVK